MLLQGVKLTNVAVENCRQPIVIKQFIIRVLLKEIKMTTNCWKICMNCKCHAHKLLSQLQSQVIYLSLND